MLELWKNKGNAASNFLTDFISDFLAFEKIKIKWCNTFFTKKKIKQLRNNNYFQLRWIDFDFPSITGKSEEEKECAYFIGELLQFFI